MRTKKSQNLSEADIPHTESLWADIATFALTFEGYQHAGSFAKCANLANEISTAFERSGKIPESLSVDELRSCLFFEQRRWRHFDDTPDGEDLRHIRSLVDRIREKVRASHPPNI